MLISHFASASGGRNPQNSWPSQPPREPLHCKILGTPMHTVQEAHI